MGDIKRRNDCRVKRKIAVNKESIDRPLVYAKIDPCSIAPCHLMRMILDIKTRRSGSTTPKCKWYVLNHASDAADGQQHPLHGLETGPSYQNMKKFESMGAVKMRVPCLLAQPSTHRFRKGVQFRTRRIDRRGSGSSPRALRAVAQCAIRP